MANVDLASVLAVFGAMTVAAALPALLPRLGILIYPTLGPHRLAW